MDMTTELASQESASDTPFGAILRDAITEMEAYEVAEQAFEDVIQRLSLAAHHAIATQAGGPLPRVGGYVYQTAAVALPAATKTQLDVRF
ncbi:MAG: hypothetical protein ACO1Q7_11845 [Gemmatimonas sp.]